MAKISSRLRSRLAAAGLGSILALLGLGAVEGLLRISGVFEGVPVHDPFAGFSETIPTFVPDVGADGRPIYRVSAARSRSGGSNLEESLQRRFLAEKPRGALRVFVVGGSSAAGVPYGDAYAFPRWLSVLLQHALPGQTVEVVNAAFSGFATRRLLMVVREIADYEPDLLIVYAGHNEWAEDRFYRHLLDLDPRLFETWERITQLRIYRMLASLLVGRPEGGGVPQLPHSDDKRALEMFAVAVARTRGEAQASARDVAYRELHYRFNLREMTLAMERVGARVLLASIAQNLSDWPPGASLHRRDFSDEELRDFDDAVRDAEVARARGDLDRAVASYRRAIAIDDGFAQTHFDLARVLRDLGRIEDARRHFVLASDLDKVPHGAQSAFNDVVAEVARERGAVFVDLAAVLRRSSGRKLVGDDLFLDMVHPNLAAHQIIARALFDGLRRAGWPSGARWEPLAPLPSPQELFAADPHLRFLEQQVRLFACQLAMRPACAEDAAAIMRALEPENPIIESLMHRARDLRGGQSSR